MSVCDMVLKVRKFSALNITIPSALKHNPQLLNTLLWYTILKTTLTPLLHLVAEGTTSLAPRALDDSILEISKTLVSFGLSQVPIVGDVLSLLINLFWPSSAQNVWEQVRAEVEKMIDQKINGTVFNLFQGKLNGLGGVMKEFLQAVKTGNNENIRTHFVACKVQFAYNIPEFKNPAYEWLLAPLYALMTQMHMSLLRDGKLHGISWGMDAAVYAQTVADFASFETQHDDYLGGVVARKRTQLQPQAPTAPGTHRKAIHDFWQPFEQHTIVLIDDYRRLVRAFKEPKTYVVAFQDVYSLAYGTADVWEGPAATMSQGSGSVSGVYSRPLGDIQKIDMEFFNAGPRVINVTYPVGKGPMLHGGARVDKYGVIAPLRNGKETATATFTGGAAGRLFHIRAASVRLGSIPLALTLIKDTGATQWLWDRHFNPGGSTVEVAVPGRMLTTLNMWTHSTFYDYGVGLIIFGFSRDPQYVPPGIQRIIYVGSIGEPELGDLDGSDPTLKSDRKVFWHGIETYKPEAKEQN